MADAYSSKLLEVLGLTALALAAALAFVYLLYRMKTRRERGLEEQLEREEESRSQGFARSVIERELSQMQEPPAEPA